MIQFRKVFCVRTRKSRKKYRTMEKTKAGEKRDMQFGKSPFSFSFDENLIISISPFYEKEKKEVVSKVMRPVDNDRIT